MGKFYCSYCDLPLDCENASSPTCCLDCEEEIQAEADRLSTSWMDAAHQMTNAGRLA